MIPLAPRHRSLRILCIEEDEVQKKLLGACLEIIGAESFFAADPEDAEIIFRHHPMDLVLMDIDAHTAEELEVFEHMRALPRRRAIPILAVTDNNCDWPERAYREAGFAAVYFKPIEPARFFRTVDEILREYALPPLLADQGELFKGGYSVSLH